MKKEHLRLLPAVSLLFQHSEKKSCHQLCEALESSHKLHQNEDEVHARYPVVIAHNRINQCTREFDKSRHGRKCSLLYSLLL